MKLKERFEIPTSTLRLKEIKNSALEFLGKDTPKGHCISHSISLHFFEDCILAFYETSSNFYDIKITSAYSLDNGKTWKPYHNQFEPKEGYHRAVKYEPTEEPFPTKEW